MLRIHGVPFSAHTRKIILAASEKALAYELVPVIPLTPPAGWTEISPLGLIPAIEDGDFTLADSSVIALYLEQSYPQHPLYPSGAQARAHALWIEEFVDGGLAPHVLRGLLMQRVFAPKFLNKAPDEALIRTSLTEMIPPRLAYLEQALQGREYFGGDSFSVADIAVTSILINYHYAGETLNEQAYPHLHAHLRRTLRRESLRAAFAREVPASASIGGLDLRLLRSVGY
jgi:glutathione S-transferase